jgi:hypothetical protein
MKRNIHRFLRFPGLILAGILALFYCRTRGTEALTKTKESVVNSCFGSRTTPTSTTCRYNMP